MKSKTYATEFEPLLQGKKQTEKPQWYQDYVAEHHKAPDKKAMRRLALEVNKEQMIETVGEDITPEALVEINNRYAEMEQKLAALETLDKLKDRLYEVADSDVHLRAGLSKEGLEVYNRVKDLLKQGNFSVAHQAKEGALVFASHADTMAKIVRDTGREGYTAEDYMRDYIEIKHGGMYNGYTDGHAQPLHPSVDLDKTVHILDLSAQIDVIEKTTTKDIKRLVEEYIGTVIRNNDSKFEFLIKNKKKAKHITYSSKPNQREKASRKASILNLETIINNAAFIEDVKNLKKEKRHIDSYYRFYIPVKINATSSLVRIVAEKEKNSNSYVLNLYDVMIEKEDVATRGTNSVSGNMVEHTSSSNISIRDMLRDVEDFQGDLYVNEDGTGNFKKLDVDNNEYYQTAWHSPP